MRTRSVAVLLAAAIACGCGHARLRPSDLGGIDPTRGGVRCRAGDSLEPDRGCMGGVAVAGGERISISYRSEMSKSFVLDGLACEIDGHMVFHEKGIELPASTLGLYDAAIPPGEHELRVVMVFRGHGEGVFSYLKGYKFEVRATHNFTLRRGEPLRVLATSFEKGGATTPLEQRPAIRFSPDP